MLMAYKKSASYTIQVIHESIYRTLKLVSKLRITFLEELMHAYIYYNIY